MRGAKRFVLVVVVLFFALAIVAFVLENQQSVTLSFFGWSTTALPVSVIAIMALVAGMIIGPALGLIASRRGIRRKA